MSRLACRRRAQTLEASRYTAATAAYYVEGITPPRRVLTGPEIGWMAETVVPNYGCSSYTVSDGDNIVFCYTCNGLGADVEPDVERGRHPTPSPR